MNNPTATITAISTPSGKGGVALIRTSGTDAVSIVSKCFIPKSNKPLSEYPSRTSVYGDVILDGERIDDAIATIFRAPNSYTGEDTVEITCHGGMLITKTVLEAVLACGAHPAEAGEFTRRAFISGKLSLTDAEAIGSLLEAKTHSQILLNSHTSRNRLNEEISSLHEGLLSLMTTLYANIDFPEEDLADLTPDEVLRILESALEKLNKLCASYKTGHAVNEGISTVICGKPNVGKSTLYNTLCKGEYAIVSEYAGTTRDLLEKTVSLGRVTLNLVDTAGIHETDAPVEKIGISLSRKKIEESELIFLVLDGSSSLDGEDFELIEALSNSNVPIIAIINKSDLPQKADTAFINEKFENVVTISAKNGGEEELSAIVDRLFTDEKISIGSDAIVSGARQYASLIRARDFLLSAASAQKAGYPSDLVSSDVSLAISALSELDGRAVNEDIISGIFSHFCVGK